jgi:Ca-activated chloride channel family protein
MKHPFLPLLAIALLGALSLTLAAKHDPAATEPSVRLRVDVDRAVLPSASTEKAVVKIALDGLRPPRRELRPPVNLALVIDRSGSMSGAKIAKAREAALEAVRRLSPNDLVSLVAFDSRVETLVRAQRVGNGRRIEEAICQIEANGNTALYGGVTAAAAEVRKHSEDGRYFNRIILLSDGLANVGPNSPDDLGRLGTSFMKEGISVTTVGLGLGFNEDLMTRLAQRSDGNTYFVENSDDLPGIFAAELGEVLNVIARRVVIEIEFPAGVRPIGFVGREGIIRGQRAELTLSQIYGGQEKFALVEVEVAPNQPGEEREIARARVSYEDALNQRSATLTARRSVQFSANRAEVVASADHKVQTDYAANVMAVAKDEAVTLVDSGQRERAGAVLREKARELNEVAKEYHNSAVGGMARAAAPEADRLASEGLSNAERKIYRADSTQVKSQQSAGRP